ncbi:hypothetical protein CIG75_17650 [Tumebacillus algifaecis]|uniref:Uncharacterized protein n=1 Tax=Tumebacillus algifaecis TaxID=1214604 RepID=A0A223D525_9BACL|nr:hypothetical protein [Tumebacillus algifaecis]ASS76610.1 hypothetical protein CIG75_17650 [Tumebacillus algifaecis]
MMLMRVVLLCLLFSILPPLPTVQASTLAHDTAQKRQALLVLINRLGYDDLAAMPELQKLSQQGAIALMNVNTGGKRTDSNAYVTMAAGAPATLEPVDVQAFNADEQFQDVPVTAVYAGLHGRRADHEVLLLSLPSILRKEERWNFKASAVSLGEALYRHGLRAAVLGSGDRADVLWRPATLFTSDETGRTPYGDVSSRLLARDPARPYGVRTDYDRLWSEYQALRGQASLVVFDLADLYRLAEYRHHLDETQWVALRQTVLQELDQFIGRLAAEQPSDRMLLIASPQVTVAAKSEAEWLSPVIAVGGGIGADSVLTSATTRREGIVSNLDVAPTLLDFLQVPKPQGMIGYPLQATSALEQQRLGALKAATIWTYSNRAVVLGVVGTLIGCGLLLAVLRLYRLQLGVNLGAIRALLWVALTMPLCLYLLPILCPSGLWEVAGGLWALYLLFAAIPFRILPFCQTLTGRLTWLCTWTIAVVVCDTWQGGLLAKRGLLSYDPIVGARYYGVGNEYMGVVVGAAALLYAMLLHSSRVRRRGLGASAVLGGLLLTAFFASPALGTNTGGALTMAATTGLCFAMQKRWRPLPTLGVLAASLCVGAGLLILLNQPSAPPSHIGAAAGQVLTGGFEEMARIFARKSDMFVRLLFSSIWPTVFLLFLSLFVYLLYRDQKRAWQTRYPEYRSVIGGMLTGAVVGLFTNDSGIVVLGLISLFALFPTMLIWLELDTGPMRTPKRSVSLRR